MIGETAICGELRVPVASERAEHCTGLTGEKRDATVGLCYIAPKSLVVGIFHTGLRRQQKLFSDSSQ